ncbi:MAG TPA: linear amide C-N hydrolase [Candidatus Krumholzibacteria bacterium]|nr:linear amide C-N hydrolase [Candidatus Krumholzibacteria bacterium]
MKHLKFFAWGILLVVTAALTREASACTTFCYADGGTLVFGRNYDWNIGDGLVLVNKRGVSKRALVDPAPASWTSKYGSITFNQYGREFPTGGMNEKGLVVELMWLDETQYPAGDGRGAMPTLQWIQYQLDNCATVREVLLTDRLVRIAFNGSAKIHFLVADATGDVATIEFLSGLMIAHKGAHLDYPVLTNDTYDRSSDYAKKAGKKTGKSPAGSLERFARAASYEKNAKSADEAVQHSFAMLDDVAQGDHTQWSIVYDIKEHRAYFRTRTARDIRWIDIDGMPLECTTPVRMLDINAPLSGDVARSLTSFSADANLKLVRSSFAKTPFLSETSPELRDELANYPSGTSCRTEASTSGGK